jgi:hypothetical protein
LSTIIVKVNDLLPNPNSTCLISISNIIFFYFSVTPLIPILYYNQIFFTFFKLSG